MRIFENLFGKQTEFLSFALLLLMKLCVGVFFLPIKLNMLTANKDKLMINGFSVGKKRAKNQPIFLKQSRTGYQTQFQKGLHFKTCGQKRINIYSTI